MNWWLWSRRKIRAFTLVEVIVTLVVSGVVVSLAGSSYYVVKKQFQHFELRNKKVLQVKQLNYLLSKDFKECNKVLKAQNSIEVVYKQRPNVSYSFGGKGIIRNQSSRQDTFYGHYTIKSVQLLGEEQRANNVPIDRLTLRCKLEGSYYHIHCEKRFSARQLMKLNL
jgi:prepilin-type N-terminal cleavage/methylation domain-containing protein